MNERELNDAPEALPPQDDTLAASGRKVLKSEAPCFEEPAPEASPPPLPKPQSKLKQDREKPRPSDRLRQEPKPDKKAMLEEKRLGKSKLRMEKSGNRLDKAREKLAKQPPPPKPGMTKDFEQMAKHEAWAFVHGKIYQVEEENVGIKAAHRVELVGESVVRGSVRFIKQRIRTRPARLVRKWEKKNIKAKTNHAYRAMAREHPELKKNAVSRYFQKRRIRKQYQKQARTAKKAAAATGKTVRVLVGFVKRNPSLILIAVMSFLLVFILQSCMGLALTIFSGLGGAGGVMALAEDEDIDEAELRYGEWETDLLLRAWNAEAAYPNFDEYRYYLDAVGHDPYALLAYLTARYDDFTFAAVQTELQNIFNRQYSLIFTPSVETRYYTEERILTWTDEDGVEHPCTWIDDDGVEHIITYEAEIPYDWNVLTVVLAARPFEDVIWPRLITQEERDRYEVYMLFRGGRQYIGSPFTFNWLPHVSAGYGYRVGPASGAKEYRSGVDITVPGGTEIRVGGSGVVREAGSGALLIDYGNGLTARYAFCSSLRVSVGQTVAAGQVIAISGNMLYIEVKKDARFLNPLYFVDGTIN
ncbi:MAG: M23 family metallopeptidase [Clostridiales bacterium]|nr:M23 family metallopeptidase [Clostridiales bacterium]